jgi:ribose transport system substrate-binding protein
LKKGILKKLSILLCMATLASIVGCGQSNSTETQSSVSTQSGQSAQTSQQAQSEQQTNAKKYKIGFNNYLKGFYALDILENNAKFATESLGNEFIAVNDEAKSEKVVQNVQNLISSGVDGIVFFGIVDTLFPVVSQMCEKAKVPFVIYDHLPSDKSLEILRKNPYFVGAVGEHDYDAGFPIGEYAAREGLKKAILITGKRGDTTHEARVKGFTDSFTKAGGQVLDVGWGNSTLAEALQKAEDLITAHPDIDCIYGTGGDFGLGALQALKKHPNIKAKMYVTDLDPAVLEGLESNDIAAANGAHWVNAGFSVAMLQNYLESHQLKDKDGQVPVVTVPILVLPAKQEKLYKKFWIDSQPYSSDEIKNLTYSSNKDISLDSFQKVLIEYSIKERLLQRQSEGKITEAEFKDVFEN